VPCLASTMFAALCIAPTCQWTARQNRNTVSRSWTRSTHNANKRRLENTERRRKMLRLRGRERNSVCVARRRVQADRQAADRRTKNKYSNNNNVSDDVVVIAHETNNHAIINNYQSSATQPPVASSEYYYVL
jgi:hypothetical protein